MKFCWTHPATDHTNRVTGVLRLVTASTYGMGELRKDPLNCISTTFFVLAGCRSREAIRSSEVGMKSGAMGRAGGHRLSGKPGESSLKLHLEMVGKNAQIDALFWANLSQGESSPSLAAPLRRCCIGVPDCCPKGAKN